MRLSRRLHSAMAATSPCSDTALAFTLTLTMAFAFAFAFAYAYARHHVRNPLHR